MHHTSYLNRDRTRFLPLVELVAVAVAVEVGRDHTLVILVKLALLEMVEVEVLVGKILLFPQSGMAEMVGMVDSGSYHTKA